MNIGSMAVILSLILVTTPVIAQQSPTDHHTGGAPMLISPEILLAGSPALAIYNDTLVDELWRRSDLSPRDRSLATVAALIAGGNHAM